MAAVGAAGADAADWTDQTPDPPATRGERRASRRPLPSQSTVTTAPDLGPPPVELSAAGVISALTSHRTGTAPGDTNSDVTQSRDRTRYHTSSGRGGGME